MSVWKQLVITSQLDDRIERLRDILGYKAKWRVLDEALKLLEEKVADRRQLFVDDTLSVISKNKLPTTRNIRALLGLIFRVLDDTRISIDQKDAIIVAMIEAGIKAYRETTKPMDEAKEEKEAEAEADALFNKLIAAGGVRNE